MIMANRTNEVKLALDILTEAGKVKKVLKKAKKKVKKELREVEDAVAYGEFPKGWEKYIVKETKKSSKVCSDEYDYYDTIQYTSIENWIFNKDDSKRFVALSDIKWKVVWSKCRQKTKEKGRVVGTVWRTRKKKEITKLIRKEQKKALEKFFGKELGDKEFKAILKMVK